MGSFYEYSEYNDYNRFINIDGVEAKIIQHLLNSETKYAEYFWKILKYDTVDALSLPNLTKKEKCDLIDGYSTNVLGGQTDSTRVFFSPFVDDAWNKESSSAYIYVKDITPIDHTRATLSVAVETVIHAKINAILGDADELSNKENTNPNDYYYTDPDNPTVVSKSRATVLLKCILAELNGLYIDGIGYLQFDCKQKEDPNTDANRATSSVFNRRSFFGHIVKFELDMSGVSGNSSYGW